MKCPKCGKENPEGLNFCGKCGTGLEKVCPQCQFPNPSDFEFCGKCGRPLVSIEYAPQAKPSQHIETQPTTFASGRYEIKELLGEGGKKKVYRAYDTLLDRDVALALIKTEGMDKESMARITREAQAMGRLGAHPNIVTVFDLGRDNDQPYIVTELMGGGDIEALMAGTENHHLEMDQVMEIAESVCKGLEFAHGKGVIHRDLKPGNVWITEEGIIKIGDFGLALVEDRTRLTGHGFMLGTVSYMAPEQAVGGEITPQSDLYSLGAMLYEMTTGRPPFIGDDPVAIIGQHLNTPPVSPSWHNKDISSGLETLILRLLEKDALNRPSSASEVLRSLDLIRRGVDGEEIIPEPSPKDTRAPVYRQIFVGREAELKQLKTAFDNALSGHGSLIMVVGEPGIGKTALTQQLATYVTMRGGSTLVGHCYEEGSLSLPYLAFVEAMRTYVLNRDEADLRRDMGSGASEVARIVSEVRDKLHVEPRPPTNPDEDRYRLFQAVTDFLSHASEVEPLLIVLEDLHDADKGTLDLLIYITHRLSKGRFLLIGTYRDIEVDRSHPLASTLAELRRVSTYERILLRGLTIDEVQRMLSGLSGQVVEWQIAEAVHKQTEGNPLFVQEVLRYAVEGGLIIRESGQWRAVDPNRLLMSIPEGLRDVIGKRLSHLSPECGQVLSMASVMGREFRFEVLQKLSNLPDEALFAALQEAINAAVIEERTLTGAAVKYRFTHAFIRQALYEEMIAPRRNQLHIRTAKALEELFAARLPDHAVELAEHFSHSTNPEDLAKAVNYGQMGAERATAVFDYGEAVRLLEQTIQVQEVLDPTDHVKKTDLLNTLGDLLVWAGDPKRVIDEIAPTAFALAEQIGDKKRAVETIKLALRALPSYGWGDAFALPVAADWTRRADQYGSFDKSMRTYADAILGMFKNITACRLEAIPLLNSALALAREIDDEDMFLFIAMYWMIVVSTPQYAKEQKELCEEVLTMTKGLRLSDKVLCMALTSRILFSWGNRERAEILWKELEEIIERTKQPNFLILLKATKATQACVNGELDEAFNLGWEVFNLGEVFGLKEYTKMMGRFTLTRTLVYLGNTDTLLNTIIEEISNSNPYPYGVLGLAYYGRTELAKDMLETLLWDRSKTFTPAYDTWVWEDILLIEASVMLGHIKATDHLLKRISKNAIYLNPVAVISCTSRHLGAAAAFLNRPEEARNHYLEAIRVCTETKFRPELALTRLQLAELLLEQYPQERSEAIAHLDFSIAEFQNMKMQPSLERALKHKEMLKA
jgi:tetratricopeptide (TPR) repeat protein